MYDEKVTPQMVATFLGFTKQLDLPADWNDESHSKLWVYNLHYFEDLLTVNAAAKYDFHIELLNRWAADNPVGYGNGWEPYPISLRVPNILKAWLAGLPLQKQHFKNVFEQASFLSNDLEKHLLGNHYFVNLKALLFAGVIFNNTRWLKLAVKGLMSEIPEQTLEDGANFELTPMYHSLILVDMLDMYNLSKAYPKQVPEELTNIIEVYIPKMLNFMQLVAHNDQGVSFFNDSVDGIAPSQARINAYALALGFALPELDIQQVNAIDSRASGYMVATHSGNKLIFDAGNVGPDYIPGHAHADTLAFELSIGSERVFVNTGTSQYGLGAQRLKERKTLSHNTVEVDGLDSSQVWSGFRVAQRARITSASASVMCNTVQLKASHNGYYKIYGGPHHQRSMFLEASSLRVKDELNGRFTQAKARFYLHPSLVVTLINGNLRVVGKRFELLADLTGRQAILVKSNWHPGFGISKQNNCLEVTFSNPNNLIEFTWNAL
ncbi:heparinase II/III family protein [Pseudoalteromonas sp. P1-13-1a]|uniref:heparinase II/III family protein n=1 Tax=Pseudoalteromonas sp. P1-13-1a TaxID=1723756 RepID=UPI0006D6800E|nr:alginate lyase family protein [Pseudoalteromonas sp. P1-13-1a]